MIPDYAVLLILFTVMYLATSLSAMATFGISNADLPQADKRRFGFGLAGAVLLWAVLILPLAYTNVLVPRESVNIPYLGILLVGATVMGHVLILRSPLATAILRAIPVHLFAAIQIYRVIGVVFLLLASDNLLSGYFANTTGWGDIFVGVTAPIVAYLLWKERPWAREIALMWNVVGIGDLILVVGKAITSAPGPLRIDGIEPATTIIGYFPFPVIPLFVVPISIILHLQMMRKLLGRV